MIQSTDLKVMLCQVKPKHKEIHWNIERVNVSLMHYSAADKFDLIVFPELAFTGYNFEDSVEAYPFAQECNSDAPTFDSMKRLAVRLQSYIAFGYIEKVGEYGNVILYNSAAVLNRQGTMVCNYRKKHLYYNDKLWAREGDTFKCLEIRNTKERSIRCALGICMDINQKQFSSQEFELADFILERNADVLIFMTNWVDSSKVVIRKEDVAATYNYWLHRLSPVIKADKHLLVLVADRVGQQFDVFTKQHLPFYGSSCSFKLKPLKFIKNLNEKDQGYLIIQTSCP